MHIALASRRFKAVAVATTPGLAGVAVGVVHSVTAGAAEPVPPSLRAAIDDRVEASLRPQLLGLPGRGQGDRRLGGDLRSVLTGK
jgi:hypothetical protein